MSLLLLFSGASATPSGGPVSLLAFWMGGAGSLQADAPPYSARQPLPGILAAWLPADPSPQIRQSLSAGVPGQSIDAPPSGRLDRLHAIRSAWQPSDPQPQRSQFISAGIPGQSVDRPPIRGVRAQPTQGVWWDVPPPSFGRRILLAISRSGAKSPGPPEFTLFNQVRRTRTLANLEGRPNGLVNLVRRAGMLANLEGRANALVNLIRRMGSRP